MRVIGIDPASKLGGIAIVDMPDKVIAVEHWKRDEKRSHPQGFMDYYQWLGFRIYKYKPHMAVIEFHSYTGPKSNAKATQSVAFYQSISALTCKLFGVMVIEARATTVRRIVLGNGGLAKDAVWEIMRKKHPDLFSAKTQGGLDECDALVLALAGEGAAER